MTASRQDFSNVEIIDRSIIYDGFFQLSRTTFRHRKFDGCWSGPIVREVFDRGHSAGVLLYDPDADAVVLIEQFRVAAMDAPSGPWPVEIVAGVIDAGQTAEDVVRREAVEETGCAVTALEPVLETQLSPGGCTERITLFVGRIDVANVSGLHGRPDEGEDIRPFVLPFDDALTDIGERITTAPAVLCLFWLRIHRAQLRGRWRS